MTNIVGAAFLGLTVGCARCHDHKFDPIRQSDYYRLQAFFAATARNATSSARDARAGGRVEGEDATDPGRDQGSSRADVPVPRQEDAESLEKREKLTKQIEELEETLPAPLPSIQHASMDSRTSARPIHVLTRGEHADNKGDRSGMRPLGDPAPARRAGAAGRRRDPRTELAEVARRARKPADRARDGQPHLAVAFRHGASSTRPTTSAAWAAARRHPELLDCLANEFVAGGFSVKQMHRLILSAAPTGSRRPLPRTRRSRLRSREGPGQQAALALPPAAARGRGDPRRDARGLRAS